MGIGDLLEAYLKALYTTKQVVLYGHEWDVG